MLITGLDHLVVLVRDLDAGVATYRTLLGCEPSWRGANSASAMFTLANISLEILAPNGDDRVRAVLDAQSEGLASLCFRVSDIAKIHRRLDRLGLTPEDIADGNSTDTTTGSTLSWRRTRAATEAAHGVRLFFLEMQNERPRSEVIAEGAIAALDHVVVSTHNPERAAALYGARLGLDMALDRARPDWGRLMFFRCGDLIVEVVQRPGQNDFNAPDKVWGLSWRAANIEVARARLVAAGADVSDIRGGRKPGTRIMTVRTGTCGVPTVVLQPSPKR